MGAEFLNLELGFQMGADGGGGEVGLFRHTERGSAEMVRWNGVPRRGDEMGAQNGRLKNKWRQNASSTDYAQGADALES